MDVPELNIYYYMAEKWDPVRGSRPAGPQRQVSIDRSLGGRGGGTLTKNDIARKRKNVVEHMLRYSRNFHPSDAAFPVPSMRLVF